MAKTTGSTSLNFALAFFSQKQRVTFFLEVKYGYPPPSRNKFTFTVLVAESASLVI